RTYGRTGAVNTRRRRLRGLGRLVSERPTCRGSWINAAHDNVRSHRERILAVCRAAEPDRQRRCDMSRPNAYSFGCHARFAAAVGAAALIFFGATRADAGLPASC